MAMRAVEWYTRWVMTIAVVVGFVVSGFGATRATAAPVATTMTMAAPKTIPASPPGGDADWSAPEDVASDVPADVAIDVPMDVAIDVSVDVPADAHVFTDLLLRGDADPDGRIAHEYVWEVPSDARLFVLASAEFDAYLEVEKADGRLVAMDDDSGGESDAFVDFQVDLGGEYRITVTSAAEDETGAYTLIVWASPSIDTAPRRVGRGRAAVPGEDIPALPVGELFEGVLHDDGALAVFALPVPAGGATYDVWLWADSDFDLYAAAVRADEPGTYQELASEGPYGYEHVRIELPDEAWSVEVQVILYEDHAANGTFFLLVEEARSDRVGPSYDAVGAGLVDAGAVKVPFAGHLYPGRRHKGAIDGERYATQFWLLEVPEGVREVSVGLFEATADFDLSMARGWHPVPEGFLHEHRRATPRLNERIVLTLSPSRGSGETAGKAAREATGETTGEMDYVEPGVYTVAVWLAQEWEGTYEVEVAFDRMLPPSARYEGPSPEIVATLSGMHRAQLAAVRIQSEFSDAAGALLTPDGLIVTNYHVVAPCHPVSSAPVGCERDETVLHDDKGEYLVSLFDPYKGESVQLATATLLDALPEEDLALLQMDFDIDGRPWGEAVDGPLPFVPVRLGGSDSDVNAFRALATLGYDGNELVPGTATPIEAVLVAGTPVLWQLASSGWVWSSGGLLLDGEGSLVAVTTGRYYRELDKQRDDEEQTPQRLAHPVTRFPQHWLRLIEARGGQLVSGFAHP